MYKWRADRTCAFATPTLPSMPFRPELMPADLVAAFLHQLADGRDLWSCSLVNRAFNDAATPLLYRSIRTFSPAKRDDRRFVHPFLTILRKPQYGLYVRKIDETADFVNVDATLVQRCLQALQLCRNLSSFSWTDEGMSSSNGDILLAYIGVLRSLPLRQFHATFCGVVSSRLWARIVQIQGLHTFSIDAHKILSAQPTVFSSAPHLRELRIGALSTTHIYRLFDALPSLAVFIPTFCRSVSTGPLLPLPSNQLSELVVNVDSRFDAPPDAELWSWVQWLLPPRSLERLEVNSDLPACDNIGAPPNFLQNLAERHSGTLKALTLRNFRLDIGTLAFVCTAFPALEVLECSVSEYDMAEADGAVSHAHNIKQLTLSPISQWRMLPPTLRSTMLNPGIRGDIYQRHAYDLMNTPYLSTNSIHHGMVT